MEMDLELIEQKSFDTPICVCCWNPKIPGRVVTGDLNGNVRLWNLNSERKNDFQPLMTTKAVNGCSSILSIAIHPDGDLVAVSSSNGTVRLTRISKTRGKISIFGEPSEKKGKAEAKATPQAKGKGKRKNEQPEDELQPKQSEYAVHQIQFNFKGTHLAGAGGVSASVKVWSDNDNIWKMNECIQHHDIPCLPTEEPPKCYPLNFFKGTHKNFITSVAWSPSGNQVASGSMGGSIYVFDVLTNQLLRQISCTTMSVTSLAYASLNLLVSASFDKCIRMHDLEEKEDFELPGHLDCVLSVDVCPNNKTIASCSGDRTLKLWDIETRKLIMTRANHKGNLCGVNFIGMLDKEIRLATLSADARIISLYKYCSG